ncbi:MAG: hypothetical protein ACYTAQ_15140 [Planctomycetota bacterium]|jgi:hypothetical protein
MIVTGSMLVVGLVLAGPPRGYTIPLVDLAGQRHRQVVVDRESPSTPRATAAARS